MASDHWRPSASLAALRQRAQLCRHIRAFFAERDVLEVHTPAMGRYGVTDPAIEGIAVPGHGMLQTSPEYHMKRLLAAGCGPIYQIATAFRDGERGQRHNPEFTLLEWYQPGYSLERLVQECADLLAEPLGKPALEVFRFRELFEQLAGHDPLSAPLAQLRQAIPAGQQVPELDRAGLVDWLMACVVEPALPAGVLVAVTDFPPWAAALAQLKTDSRGDTVAQRMELYFNGLELANGYLELTDASEQADRFRADCRRRQEKGLPARAVDPQLMAALACGLPDCAGVAVGLERVLMAAMGAQSIDQVLAFPSDRA